MCPARTGSGLGTVVLGAMFRQKGHFLCKKGVTSCPIKKATHFSAEGVVL